MATFKSPYDRTLSYENKQTTPPRLVSPYTGAPAGQTSQYIPSGSKSSSTTNKTSTVDKRGWLSYDQVKAAYEKHTTPYGWTSKVVDTAHGKEMMFEGRNQNGDLICYSFPLNTSSSSTTNKTQNSTSTTKPTNTGGGGGGSSSTVKVETPKVNKIDWQLKSIDEMSKLVGMDNYKYEDILKLYNDASNAKFNEYDTLMKREQADNLRSLQNTYDTYLDTMRENRSNAISNGMTKGTAAAQQLASLYGVQQSINEDQQAYHDTIYDLVQQRGTALEENKLLAQQERRDVEKYLGDLRGTYEANSVNELAARLSLQAQLKAAEINANATTKAAGIQAAASRYAATAGQDQVLGLYQSLYGETEGNRRYLEQVERSDRATASYYDYLRTKGE